MKLLLVAAVVLATSGAVAQKGKDKKDKDQQQQQQQDQQNQPAQTDQQKPADKKNADQPAPLFGGKVGLKSSRQDKDVATLGFNGLDEKGMVAKQFLESSPSASDEVKVQMLANYTVDKEELVKFIQDGKLKSENQKLEPSKVQ